MFLFIYLFITFRPGCFFFFCLVRLQRLKLPVYDWTPNAMCTSTLLLMGEPLPFMASECYSDYEDEDRAQQGVMEVRKREEW